jgi:hypothetical protein
VKWISIKENPPEDGVRVLFDYPVWGETEGWIYDGVFHPCRQGPNPTRWKPITKAKEASDV